jgi:hypothetical protein
MKFRTLGGVSLAIAVIAAMVPAAAASASSGGSGSGQPSFSVHHRVDVRGGSASDSVKASTTRSLQAHAIEARTRLVPSAVSPESALEDFQNPFAVVNPAGDLTGNGRKDVLDERFTLAHHRFGFGATARDGRTGRALWTRKVKGASRVGFPITFAPVGKPARRGLLVGMATAAPAAGGSESVSLSIEAWSGKTGKTLWTSAPVTGTVSRAHGVETDAGVPTPPDAIHALAGTEDVLVPTETSVVHPRSGSGSGSATATLVNGSNGGESTPYSTVASTTAVPTIQPVNDISGDGRSDVLEIAPGSPGSLTAEAGDTGKRLWRDSLSLERDTFVSSAGRISGGSAPDLIVESRALRIVRGQNGKVLWFRKKHAGEDFAPDAFRIPAGPHGLHAVALVSTTNINTGNRFGAALTVRAVTATGHLVWRRQIAASMAFSGPSGGSLSAEGPIGDVQPDGSRDLMVLIQLISGHHRKSVIGTVSGSDGAFQRLRHVKTFVESTAGSLVHGAGTDLLTDTSIRHAVRVAGYDGVSGRRLMRTMIPTQGRSFSSSEGLRLTGHGCSDIEMNAFGRRHGQTDVLSGGGSRLWQLRYGENQDTGGHLVTFKAPTHFCAP